MNHDLGLLYSQDVSMTISSRKQKEKQGEIAFEEYDIIDLKRRTQEHNVHWTIKGERDFPAKARHIISSPHILYYLGNLDLLQLPILGIVGPREHSPYATQVLQHLFSHTKNRSFATISGGAPGVDQQCHARSLKNNIPTIAVLGGGIRWFLQSTERDWMQKVVDAGGLILSEFKLDQQPQTYTYPQRNRIVAGLADVIFLPEAGKKSGSLITVEYALQMHRPVYGVPNSIFSATSEGINDYISQGKIHMTKNCKEFLDRYFPQDQEAPVLPIPENLSPQEQAVVSCIQDKELCSLSDIMITNKISAQETIAMLTILEMKQCIYQETPGVYRAVNN